MIMTTTTTNKNIDVINTINTTTMSLLQGLRKTRVRVRRCSDDDCWQPSLSAMQYTWCACRTFCLTALVLRFQPGEGHRGILGARNPPRIHLQRAARPAIDSAHGKIIDGPRATAIACARDNVIIIIIIIVFVGLLRILLSLYCCCINNI